MQCSLHPSICWFALPSILKWGKWRVEWKSSASMYILFLFFIFFEIESRFNQPCNKRITNKKNKKYTANTAAFPYPIFALYISVQHMTHKDAGQWHSSINFFEEITFWKEPNLIPSQPWNKGLSLICLISQYLYIGFRVARLYYFVVYQILINWIPKTHLLFNCNCYLTFSTSYVSEYYNEQNRPFIFFSIVLSTLFSGSVTYYPYCY